MKRDGRSAEREPAGVAWVAVMMLVVTLLLSCLANYPEYPLISLLSTTSPPPPPPPEIEDVGEPLFLTPLLEAGKIEEARRLSRVPLWEELGPSYAGLFTVNKTFDSKHFIWFFPAREGWEDAPIMVWLDGGPGVSSMFSLFNIHGPFSVNEDGELVPREHSSIEFLNIAFIDNPVFSGYSYSKDEMGVPRDQTQVGIEVHSAVTQLLQMFPEIRDNPLFVVGHSYGGKFVPALGHAIHVKNRHAEHRINLKGIAIGNGLVEPESLIHYGDMLYVLGIVDEKERQFFKAQCELARLLVRRGDLLMAQKVVGSLMGADEGRSHYGALVGVRNVLDFVHGDVTGGEKQTYYEKYVKRPFVRRALHVGNLTYYSYDGYLGKFYKGDVMRNLKPWLEEMLNNSIKVMLFNGQLDLSLPYASSEMLARSLHWDHAQEYLEAPRRAWRVEGQLFGYVREARGLVRVLVRCSGHEVGYLNPLKAVDLVKRFMLRDTFL